MLTSRPLRHLSLCAAFGGLLTCGAAAQAAEALHLYNWGDYINPQVLTRFTEETGIKVSLDTYGSNEEMLAKLQAGAKGYDIVFPSVHMQDTLAALGLLEKTDINQSPAFANIDPAFLRAKSDPRGEYCMPYAWGSVGILYNRNKVSKPIESWADFFAEAEAGKKVILLDDMRETLGVGLIESGKSVNSTDPADLKLAQDWLLARKPLVSAFTYDSVPMVQSGDVAAAHYFVGAMMYVRQDPENLAYVIPKGGATMYQEDICVLKSAPNKANAKRFMEFFLQPEIAALNTAQQMNGTPNREALKLLPAELRDDPQVNPPAEVMARLQLFTDLGKDLKQYDRAWTRVRTAN
ncbi:polyamine ABC transporter substrate-binding protein [Phytopseudomonas dryadis]|uniref:Putrescine-binding periplasmic protein n=1 Tax=Phytopseudomonas dryadis TaxID=2487520 RepID=A0A4Q9QV59_9GAMM|nr:MULTISPECIES: spermidine/putrescine ABC transporter substrate-binding protein [Pseudomonas]TBU87528.1 ABC transporter substrate-binding protein [Pseudomonas dryadis]TBV06442.1 ABC transporter substrate-binding protein [Pseudomonas dryadis]TBV17909.1 ABC transporter substrate-binding protein [Pseudomonas sp. FRB 230]